MTPQEILEKCYAYSCCPLGLALIQNNINNSKPNPYEAAETLAIPESVACEIVDLWDNDFRQAAAELASEEGVL